ncbi:FAD binding domain-containing protein [Globomyces pollinis-pini]|nr:FAD binding domain-containing protein [Globomyces pollinis-pini]
MNSKNHHQMTQGQLKDCDVLIIGAGPVGLTSAAELIRQGINFQIIDQRLEPEIKSTGTAINPPTLEVFEPFGIVPELMNYGSQGNELQIQNESPILKFSFQSEFKKYTKYPVSFGIEQWFTERTLNNYLLQNQHSIIRGIKIIDLKDEKEYVTVDYVDVNDTDETVYQIKVKYIIAADGAKSNTRKRLGIKYEGVSNTRTSAVAHFEAEPIEIPDNTQIVSFHQQGGYFLLKMPKGYATCIPLLESEEQEWISDELDSHGNQIPLPIADHYFEKLFAKRGLKVKVKNIIWKAHFRPNNRVASNYSNKNRIFLIGDAVHSSDPMAGLGLNYGVQDAANLTWKIAFVVKGLAHHGILDSYEIEMKPYGELVVKSGISSGVNALPVSSTHDFIRSHYLKFASDYKLATKGILNLYNMDKQYNSKLTRFVPGPCSIQRLRYQFITKLEAGQKFPSSLFDHLTDSKSFIQTTGFKLLIFNLNQQPQQMEQMQHIKGITFTQIINSFETELVEHCGVLGDCILLIRPDNFVGLRSHSLDMSIVLDYMNAL